MKTIIPRETDEQAVLADWLRLRGVGFFSVPNGAVLGGRNKWGLVAKLRKEGWLPGAPDLVLIPLAPATCQPVCIELKRRKDGKLRKSQEAVLPMLEQAGWVVIIAAGAQDAIDRLVKLGY